LTVREIVKRFTYTVEPIDMAWKEVSASGMAHLRRIPKMNNLVTFLYLMYD
jgi:hypothetical protein